MLSQIEDSIWIQQYFREMTEPADQSLLFNFNKLYLNKQKNYLT